VVKIFKNKSYIMKTILTIALSTLPFLGVAAQQPEASDIMNKSRELTLTGSMKATVHMSITEKNGSSRSRTIQMATKSYDAGQEKRFIKFIDPPDVKGTAMLIIDNENSPDDMWIYLPALKKTRRIVSSEKGKSFMSSEFSNADMTSPAIADFSYKHLEGSGKNNEWIIESLPVNDEKADEYGYSKKISHVSTDKNQILKMEFYNFDNELFKVIEIKGIHPLQEGKYLVKDMVASNLLNGRKSEISMSDIATGASIDDSVFTLQNLERQ
jgi:outer membrane lipoprotein-sorting protein